MSAAGSSSSRAAPVPASAAGASPFPDDPRVSFDRISGKWQCEPLPGTDDPLLEWDPDTQKWQPVIDEELVQAQQAAYGGPVDDNDTQGASKRKGEGAEGQRNKRQRPNGPSTSLAAQQASLPPGKSATSVYVTNLPLDATKEEIASVFGRYGVLLEDEPGQPRIKLYYQRPDAEREEDRMFKGEALVTYFKPESVELAVTVLDETCLRAGIGETKPLMHVARAEFGKGSEQKDADAKKPQSAGQEGGAQPAGRKPISEQEKKKIQKRNARLNDKLNDWDSDDDSPIKTAVVKNPAAPGHPSAASEIPFAASSNGAVDPSSSSSAIHAALAATNSRTVVLKHMFTLAELEEDPTLLLDLKDDVRQECENIAGEVTNVVLYDKEEDGIMSVRFKEVESARKCVLKMNGRWFASRKVEAYLAQGKPKFRRSGVGDDEDDEEDQREKAFGDWLEKGGDDDS